MQQWQCRVAPSLGGGFAGTPNKVWGTKNYENDGEPVVFFGLYGLPDFYTLWRHKGMKMILWAGSDIRHFHNGYWLDRKGDIKLDPMPLAKWLAENTVSYVENEVEREALALWGINAIVVPSFLGDIDDYPLIKDRDRLLTESKLRYYSSVSGDDFDLYGWNKIMVMAKEYPEAEFHLYGNTKPWRGDKNVFVHGRVSHEEMDKQTKTMTGAIRMTEFDGFSEILAKSVLWGQYPISLIPYPHMDSEPTLHEFPNLKGREYYKKKLNKYPWNVKNN